uniref:Uncharacterized protein n=1 Tax=Romanomermis culicivorax TaxID=13658 RepID=A0A915I6A9_ROMCU
MGTWMRDSCFRLFLLVFFSI